MGVAVDRRIGPDFEPRLVRPDAGEAQRRGDIDVGGEAARALARAAVEDFQRLFEIGKRNAALDQIGRALEPVRRFARDHGHRPDRPFGGGAHRIEPKERAGRNQDARACRLRPLHQIPVFQKLADRQRHEYFSGLDRRTRHFAKHLRRQAFHDDVARLRQRVCGHNRNTGAGLRQIAPRFVLIAHRDRREDEPGNAGFEAARHAKADGAEAGQSYLESLSRHCCFPAPGSRLRLRLADTLPS